MIFNSIEKAHLGDESRHLGILAVFEETRYDMTTEVGADDPVLSVDDHCVFLYGRRPDDGGGERERREATVWLDVLRQVIGASEEPLALLQKNGYDVASE